MESWLLDTSVAIPLRDRDPDVLRRVADLEGAILLSMVTRIELENGVVRDPKLRVQRRARLDVILSAVAVVEFDFASADAYQRIVESAGYSRRKLLDRMIAAQALVHRATLVTLNGEDFRDVPGLGLLEW